MIEPHMTLRLEKPEDKPTMLISRSAYVALGNPKFVRIAVKRSTKQIRLVPVDDESAATRKITLKSHDICVGRVAKLMRHYDLHFGIYMMTSPGIFTLHASKGNI